MPRFGHPSLFPEMVQPQGSKSPDHSPRDWGREPWGAHPGTPPPHQAREAGKGEALGWEAGGSLGSKAN